jgi:hypothetical protein
MSFFTLIENKFSEAGEENSFLKKGEKMKKYLSVLLISMFLVACSKGARIDNGGGKIAVWIERDVPGFDPEVTISADEASLDYEQRVITIGGFRNVRGSMSSAGYVVPTMESRDGKMYIKLSEDTHYEIMIGEQKHSLPIMVNQKK